MIWNALVKVITSDSSIISETNLHYGTFHTMLVLLVRWYLLGVPGKLLLKLSILFWAWDLLRPNVNASHGHSRSLFIRFLLSNSCRLHPAGWPPQTNCEVKVDVTWSLGGRRRYCTPCSPTPSLSFGSFARIISRARWRHSIPSGLMDIGRDNLWSHRGSRPYL